mmetsp:Transcript_7291/g.9510  ORF Transcript_7291/g.9510 Transcript_7291/m.9510 type:complete len:364 (+) Transcript_7291:128-1219(+)
MVSKDQKKPPFSDNQQKEDSRDHGIIVTAAHFSMTANDDTYKNLSDGMDESVTEGIDVVGSEEGSDTFLQWSRLSVGKLVRSKEFKRGVLLAIFVNSILMGVATCDGVRNQKRLAHFLNFVIRGFRTAFTIEIVLDILHYQKEAFSMGWIFFDFIIIVLSWVASLSLLVLRSFRLIRSLRKASGIAELDHLVNALLKVIPKMTAVVFLICLVFYIFAVIFTDLYQDLYDVNDGSENYFANLGRSAFTLFQIMTLDGWSDIAKEVMEIHPWSCALFIFFIILTAFFFASLVIAVMGEAFSSVANERIVQALEINNDIGAKAITKKHLSKLESRVAKLSTTMELLLKAQENIQESIKHIAEKQKL